MTLDNSQKIILDLCGGTGAWSKPYKDAGYDIQIITLPDYDVLKWRQYSDLIQIVHSNQVHGILAAPPCTIFSRADWRRNKQKRNFTDGFNVVKACLDIIWTIQCEGAPLKFWALENPLGYLYNFLGHPAFYFQGWEMGETGLYRTKRYAIWGYFNSPGKLIHRRPDSVPYTRKSALVWYTPKKPEWCKHMKLNRSDIRAITPPGFAKAFFKANP